MGKTIKPENLSKAISEELGHYHEDIITNVNAVGSSSIKELVKQTKAGAPVDTGGFQNSLSSKEISTVSGMKHFVLYAKAPFYRVFHLLVHGHAKVNGGRVPGNPFLQNAVDQVLPSYVRKVEEVLKNDK